MFVHALRHEGAFFGRHVGELAFKVRTVCAVACHQILGLERVVERPGLDKAFFLQPLEDCFGERLLEHGACPVDMMQFQNALFQDFFVDRGFRINIELELRNDCCSREFCDGLVVGRAFDFRMLDHVWFCHGFRGGVKHFGTVVFVGFDSGRGCHTLFDSERCEKVSDFVLVGHVPERQPKVHDLPAELLENLRAHVVAVFDRIAESFRGAIVFDKRQEMRGVVCVDNDRAHGNASL